MHQMYEFSGENLDYFHSMKICGQKQVLFFVLKHSECHKIHTTQHQYTLEHQIYNEYHSILTTQHSERNNTYKTNR